MDIDPNILVSIIVPTFNRSKYLEKTLKSVKNQSLQNWECIIVDDGSTDNTAAVVEKISGEDQRFQYYIRSKDFAKGACGARNYGFVKSRGKYIQWLDDDDLLSENKLELQVQKLEEADLKQFTTCDWDVYWEGKDFEPHNVIDDDEVLLPQDFFNSLVKRETYVPPHAYLIPRALAALAGPWNIHLSINQDAEYFTRIILVSNGLVNTKGCRVLYGVHDGERISSSFNSKNLASLIYGYKLIQAHLKLRDVQAKSFMKWKLRKLLLLFGKSDKELIRNNKYLFIENGVYPSRYTYYITRYKIFKIVMPWYKRYFK
ncbi:glycosyltransferase family 2 protein [Christiangramia crocea]|uniref:Glycosyltransferase family 2 protein n=1 Tax=Christiangramia crocea TaxID=2904124 RepID=A0A9X1UZ99_9FLAO|nr:glycosyltransferase family 2 protein [Gramella crocea]MCG9973028.1 glycosyltransferase family 2 protein [Gramella crocea]